MQLFDRAFIVDKHLTRDGYLAVNARVARAGNVQTYLGSEVGRPDIHSVAVFRPESEVFNKDTLASFAHRPVTLGHPLIPVTADNWASVAKGWTDGEVARDGEFVRVPMLLADSSLIHAIDSGTRQISVGYDCQIDWTPGVSSNGERYDARQTQIRGNHVAIVEAARGGPELRIGDSVMPTSPLIDERTGFVDQSLIDAEAAKPQYDAFRGRIAPNGTPLDKHYAMQNLLLNSELGQRSQAAYDHMVSTINTAHQPAQNDNKPAKQFARDGRSMSDLSAVERAYDGYVDSLNSWRNS